MKKFSFLKGFTLIEIMIALAIVAILAAIAYPSYQDSVRRSRRAEAKAAVLDAVQILERCYTQNNVYTGCTGLPTESEHKYYKITTTLEASKFTVTAEAQNAQKDDTYCAKFSVDQTGKKTAKNSAGTDNIDYCWK